MNINPSARIQIWLLLAVTGEDKTWKSGIVYWTFNRKMIRTINGFNSRSLHIMMGKDYQEMATAPAYNLVLAVRRRRLRYLGHVLHMHTDRMVRHALMAHMVDYHYSVGSLFSDCQGVALPQLVTMALNHVMWRSKMA